MTTVIDPYGLAGGNLELPDRKTAERAIRAMPAAYGLYILDESETDRKIGGAL